MEIRFLRNALFSGMTSNAFKLGTVLTLGWFWVRVAGCSVLYRGKSMAQIDFENILNVVGPDAGLISPPSYVQHNKNTGYYYVLRRSNVCGDEEHTLAAVVKVSIDADGELAKPHPNSACEIKAQQVDGNKVRFIWHYCTIEQQSAPVHFNVYYDAGTGQIDYENQIDTIYYAGKKFYSYQSDPLSSNEYLFAVRSEDATGTENCSLARIKIQLDTTDPSAIDILSIEAI